MYSVLRPLLLISGLMVMLLLYACCFPYFVWGLNYMKDRRRLYQLSAWITRMWLLGSGLGWRIRYQVPLDRHATYVFCANHTSFLDIPSVLLLDPRMVFVGNSQIWKISMFTYMYKRMHITVNRASLTSKYQAFTQVKDKLKQGASVFFFPEGGTRSRYPPRLTPFYPGAFRSAIEAQVAIVPVSILYNWMIKPKYRRDFSEKYKHQVALEVGRPISTKSMTLEQLPELIKEVRTQIQKPLESHFPSAFEQKEETTAPLTQSHTKEVK